MGTSGTMATLGSVATSGTVWGSAATSSAMRRIVARWWPVSSAIRRSLHFKRSSPMMVLRSSMLSRFINGILRRRPGMLGLDYLSAGTLSSPKVATDPWYTLNRPWVVHFGWPPRLSEAGHLSDDLPLPDRRHAMAVDRRPQPICPSGLSARQIYRHAGDYGRTPDGAFARFARLTADMDASFARDTGAEDDHLARRVS